MESYFKPRGDSRTLAACCIFRNMIKPIRWLAFLAIAFGFWGCAHNHFPAQTGSSRIPVILDTDIGDDIDDTWALLFLLKSPQFDVKLITTTNGQQDYRGRLIAKLLTEAGRTDIPIGLGAGESKQPRKQMPWIKDFPLSAYKGTIYQDGVGAMLRTANDCPAPVTIIAIGPLQTVAAALARDPSLASKTNYIGMQGSIARPVAEFNVKAAVNSAQQVFAAPWRSARITPLDTCGQPDVSISGQRFAKLQQSNDPLVKVLLTNYAIWSKTRDPSQLTNSTILYDTVAICLADPACRARLNIQTKKIRITNDGLTTVSNDGNPIDVAMTWKDLDGFRDHLVNVLLSPIR